MNLTNAFNECTILDKCHLFLLSLPENLLMCKTPNLYVEFVTVKITDSNCRSVTSASNTESVGISKALDYLVFIYYFHSVANTGL